MEQQVKTNLDGLFKQPKEPEVDESGIPYFEDGDYLTAESMNGISNAVRENKEEIKELEKTAADNKDDISYLTKLIANLLLNLSGILDVCKEDNDSILRLQKEIEHLTEECNQLKIILLITLILFVLVVILFMILI